MVSIATVVNPQAFIIGGGVSKGQVSILLMPLQMFMLNMLFQLVEKQKLLAELGNDAGIYGVQERLIV